MSEKEKKKQWEREESHFSLRIGQIQDDQEAVKREQTHLEDLQEHHYYTIQEDSRLYEELCFRCDEDERSFFHDNVDELHHLARKETLALDEKREQLQATYTALVEKEDEVTAEQRAFWKRSEEEWA